MWRPGGWTFLTWTASSITTSPLTPRYVRAGFWLSGHLTPVFTGVLEEIRLSAFLGLHPQGGANSQSRAFWEVHHVCHTVRSTGTFDLIRVYWWEGITGCILSPKVRCGAFPANRKFNWEETSCFSHPGGGSDDAGGESERSAEICQSGESIFLLRWQDETIKLLLFEEWCPCHSKSVDSFYRSGLDNQNEAKLFSKFCKDSLNSWIRFRVKFTLLFLAGR